MTDPLADIRARPSWPLTGAERVALHGIVATLQPATALVIGEPSPVSSALAAGGAEVHSAARPADLGSALETLVAAGRPLDLAFVDASQGAAGTLTQLLDCDLVRETAILIGHAANERVRAELDALRLGAWPKVSRIALDWLPGQLRAEPPHEGEVWHGIGLVVVDVSRRSAAEPVYERDFHSTAALLAEGRRLLLARDADPPGFDPVLDADRLRVRVAELLEALADAEARSVAGASGTDAEELRTANATLHARVAELQAAFNAVSAAALRSEETLRSVVDSRSWQLTRPLRGAAARRRAR